MKVRLGICWFQPEQWDQAKELIVDSDSFGASYEEWRDTTQDAITRLQAAGAIPVKVSIDLTEFSEWCSKKSLKVNSDACSQFVRVVMERQN